MADHEIDASDSDIYGGEFTCANGMVANEDFYTDRGFQATTITEGEDTLFEIPASVSLDLLKTRGLIDG